jgi:DMSO/TMAO reductase YedYZ molybdopterin-dependent catalytic subunit
VIHASCKWLSKWLGDGGQPQRLARRKFLASLLAPALGAQKAEVSVFDLSLFDELATPNDLFFVFAHFPTPAVTASGWAFSVSGAVAAPFKLPYDDLAAHPRKSWAVTLECSENPVGGGLVSHAEWTGVSLRQLLEAAKPAAEASAVRLIGADGFSRIISLAKARHPDTFLALTMNGEKLPVNHGFPLRAVIPGWYGMDSVKWLRGIEVLAGEPPPQDYTREVRALLTGRRRTEPVTAMNVKSTFSRPLDGAILFGRRFILRGAAWAGENRVRSVDVSMDGAKSWRSARMAAESKPYAWVGWSHEWKIPGPGSYELAVTATDDQGRQQPAERPFDRLDDYEFNQRQLIRVTVT